MFLMCNLPDQSWSPSDYFRYFFFVALLLMAAWLKAATPPSNDTPAGAINISYEEFCEAQVLGTLSNATSSGPAALGCNNFLPEDPTDVWYIFNAPVQISTISIDPGLSGLFPVFEIYSITDLTTPVGCSQSSGPGAEFSTIDLIPYAPYYIRVFDGATFPNPDPNADLSFSICLHGLTNLQAFFPFGTECITTNSFQLFSGFGIWKHLEFHGQGPGIGISVFDSEPLSFTSMGVYSNINNPPVDGPFGPIVDRYFSLSVTNQPVNPIRIRLFFNDAEWTRFADNFASLEPHHYALHNFSGLDCQTTYPINDTPDYVLPSRLRQISTNLWYVEYEIDHFSAFFVGQGPSALPVTYQQLSGHALANGNHLEWSTSQERNAAQFFVEKLQNDQWKTIGTVAAMGNSDRIQNYSFTDFGSYSRTAIYRLRQQDFDGTEHLSSMIRISPINTQAAIILYPNPVNGYLSIQSPNLIQKAHITSLRGQTFELPISSSGRINTAQLPAGAYQIQLIDENGHISHHRFIKT